MQVRDLVAELQRYSDRASVTIELLPDAVPELGERLEVDAVVPDAGEPVIRVIES